MAILYYLLEQDNDPGAGTETINRDLPRQGVTKALIFDISAQTVGTSAGSTQVNLASQLDQIRIGAVESNRVSEIDGEDLDAYNALQGNHTLTDLGGAGADNARLVTGYTYPLDPFMLGPRADFNQGFGIGGNVARKVEIAYAADAGNVDSKRLAIGLINNTSQGSSGGYTAFHRNSMATGTADVTEFFDVPQPGRLMNVLTFETTGATDVTTDGGHRSDQTIEEMAITVNRKVQLGPINPTTAGFINGSYEIGSVSDEGYTIWDLGTWNTGRIGLPQASNIPSNMEVKVKRGDATDAGRVYPVTLNTNT